jgi:hypothetical protein
MIKLDMLGPAQFRYGDRDMAPQAAEICQRAIADREGQGIEARRLQGLQHAILTEQAPHRGPLGW